MTVWIVEERAPRSGWRSCNWLHLQCFPSEQAAADALLTAVKTSAWNNKFDCVGPDYRRTESGTCYRVYESGSNRGLGNWRIRSLQLAQG